MSMREKDQPMPELFKRIHNSCFYVDGAGNPVFSVEDFIRQSGLPDDPRVRMVVIEELRQMDPDIRILEELN
jgi:hypothetical protein